MTLTLQDLDNFMPAQEQVSVFGTGVMSENLYEYLYQKNWIKKIKVFIVTNPCTDSYKGIQVLSVEQAGILCGDIPCLVAVNEALYSEVIKALKNNGIIDFYLVDRTILSTTRYFAEGDSENILAKRFYEHCKSLVDKKYQKYKILLLSIPFWDVYSPFSAVPSLIGALSANGISAHQIDLGIECFHVLLENTWKCAVAKFFTFEYYEQNVCTYIGNPYKSFEEYQSDLWFLSGSCFSLDEVRQAYDAMNDVQRGVLHDFFAKLLFEEGGSVNFEDADFNIQQSIEHVSWVILWKTLLKEKNLLLFSNLPPIVGIAATGLNQFLSACKMATIVRKVAPKTKIVLGGSAADLFMDSFYQSKEEIFQYFDFIVIGEGETAVTKLCRYLESGQGKLKDIPNLAYLSSLGKIQFTYQFLENVEELPLADYSDLDLSLYLAPRRILPYQASRGCHYGYCAFCNHNEKYRHNYRMKSARKVVNEMAALSEKYQTDDFQFVDEAIRPDHFRSIVANMEENNIFKKVHWMYYSRVSREYDAELLKQAVNCGCRMVMFGVETFNNRLLKFIRKGIVAETSKATLELFHESGIITYAWMMCNLPSETVDEVRADIRELCGMLQFIDMFSVGMFSLEINTDMYKEPEKFNITAVDMKYRTMFSSFYHGETIDKDAMIACFRQEYYPLMKKYFFLPNRYYVYFKSRS